MKDIVYRKGKVLLADSRVIADGFLSTNKSILNLVRNHQKGLRKFGKVTFKKAPTESGQSQVFVELNEPQTMLLLTYTRSNDKTDMFREELVNEFFSMREAIKLNQIVRLAGKEVRKSLTDVIEDSGENERMHGHGHGNFTKLVYSLVGLTEKKKFYGKKDGFRDILNPDELGRVKTVEAIIKPLLELDMDYGEIKETLKPLFEVKKLEV